MKKILAGMAMLGVLAGCSSTPETQKAVEVTDGKVTPPPQNVKPPPRLDPPPVVAAIKPQESSGDPLNPLDPKSMLNKQRSVFFDYDSYVVKDEYKPMVTAHSKFLTTNRSQKVIIQGNTDERGSREYNIALGQRRADSVKQMMILLGVQEAQVESVSLGEEKPRNPGHDEAAFSENRRGDIVYTGDK